MHSPEATLYCPNSVCQAPNPESHRFCQQCRTSLPKRYLWAVGQAAQLIQPGELLNDRYWCKQSRIFLDTKPGLLPESPDDLPGGFESYLKLFSYQQHIPQIYTLIPIAQAAGADLVLLENAPIYPFGIESGAGAQQTGQLMPTLVSVWSQSRVMRQLNWLWQIAQLWDPLQQQGVAATLLNPTLIRVEGGLLRLLELQHRVGDSNHSMPPTLADLGHLWSQWQPSAQPAIAEFMAELCQNLMQGTIVTGEQLLMALDQAIAVCGQSQSRQLRIATLTDQGPTRQRNEDACYPASGTITTITLTPPTLAAATRSAAPLVLVCDGIGGHEGGNIASNLAIETIQKRLQPVLWSASPLDPTRLTIALEEAALEANDRIAERNDQEQRQERQRMGTTLVMALGQGPELYITHVGDSRAYWISQTDCHQITLDDDLAAREVRLGYSLYREALQQPSSGSLVQALGMNTSAFLHPTVQRFVLDEDSLFLLCSDGLSDNDRVQEYWQSVLLPVLEGTSDVGTAAQQLVTIANQQNGHDNVTVGLIHCQVVDTADGALAPLPAALATPRTSPLPISGAPQSPTYLVPTQKPPAALERATVPLVPILVGLLCLLGLGVLTFFLFPNLGRNERMPTASEPTFSPSPLPPRSPISPSPANPAPVLSVQSRIQVTRTTLDSAGQTPLILLSKPAVPAGNTPAEGSLLPGGTVLEVIGQQVSADNKVWLQLKVCSLPEVSLGGVREVPGEGLPVAIPGSTGWIEQSTIAPLVTSNLSLTAAQLGQCTVTPARPPAPTTSQPPTPNP